MDVLNHLLLSLQIAIEPGNLMWCFVGCLFGTLVGVLPGLGPLATISLLLPITFYLTPVHSIIMLAGIYYGAAYGGTTTSVLLNMPGEACTMITCLDGYQMAKKGRAGAALGISVIGSFIGGTIGVILITILAPPLAEIAIKFGPPEYVALMVLGLMLVTYLSSGSMIKALMMTAAGLLLGCIGTDLVSGAIRFSFGLPGLSEGLDLVPVVMGLFGIAEVMLNIEGNMNEKQFFKTTAKDLVPSRKEFKDSVGPIGRGSILGFFLGVLPGGGAVLSSIVAYAVEKKISKFPEKFGTGYIPGVAGPETANNAASQGAFIPLLSLGIPGNPVIALLMGAMILQGIAPGPLLMDTHPNLFWGVVGSMYTGNVMLVLLNLPLIGIWVKLLRVPYVLLFPVVLMLCVIGAYSINNNFLEIYIMIFFGVVGYLMKKFDYPAAPVVLALILGPMLEKNLGQSLMMSNGSFAIFLSRPIPLTMLVISFILLVSPLFLKVFKKRRPGLLVEDPQD